MNQGEKSKPAECWRIRIGSWMFTVPFVMFIGTPLIVPFLGLSGSQATAVIGGVIVAAEVIWFASIPLLGLQGFKDMKKKSFGFLKLTEKPVTKERFKFGVNALSVGVGIQLILHVLLLVGYVVYGASPGQTILGLNFEGQAAVYGVVLVIATICTVVGVYSLGGHFADRMKSILTFEEN